MAGLIYIEHFHNSHLIETDLRRFKSQYGKTDANYSDYSNGLRNK